MKFEEYLNEGKKMTGTMIGFGLSKNKLKSIIDYVESWMKRYEVDYEMTKNLHFTLAQITGKYEKDELIREIDKLSKGGIQFKPKGVSLFRGINIKRDFIVMEYKPNDKYINSFKEVAKELEIRKFESVRPHVSICNIEQNKLDKKLYVDMVFSFPKLPTMKAKEIELWNSKFAKEYKRRL